MSKKSKYSLEMNENLDPYLFSLLESLGDKSIYMLDSNLNFIGFNTKYVQQVLANTGLEIGLGDNYFDLFVTSANRDTMMANFKKALVGNTFTLTETNAGKGKNEIHQTSFSSVNMHGKVIGLIAITSDTTYQKDTEMVWELLLKISEQAQSADNIGKLVEFIHNKLNEVIYAKNFYIALYDGETKRYFLPYFVDEYDKLDTTGVDYNFDKLSGITLYDLSKTLTDYVRTTGKPLNYTKSLDKMLQEKGNIEIFGTFSQSWLGVPLKVSENILGVLTVQSYEKEDVYSKKDEDLLVFVSEHIARAIEKKTNEEKIRKQHELVTQQKNDITDSIRYARYIQSSILPKPEKLDLILKEHFVLFLPKDIVSGDFYWAAQVENKSVLAAVDCTGHGVPGAFMSMLGAAFLNEIVNKEYITHPGVILRRLRKEVIGSLQQKGETGEQKDGMDIALIVIDFDEMVVQFAGANNPLYLVRETATVSDIGSNNQMEHNGFTLYEFKGDRMPISFHDKMDKFTMREINLLPGDCLYIFTDGYADQFGGPDGKKLHYKNLKRILLENYLKPVEVQKTSLEKELKSWKGNHEQVDDILIMGVRIE